MRSNKMIVKATHKQSYDNGKLVDNYIFVELYSKEESVASMFKGERQDIEYVERYQTSFQIEPSQVASFLEEIKTTLETLPAKE